jgi:integrase
MATTKTITLCWYAKVGETWRYFPALFEDFHGMQQARYGWVMDRGELKEYPQGRYVLRSYIAGKKVYQPVESSNPRDAVLALQKAKRFAIGPAKKNPLTFTKTAAAAYIKDCESRQAFEAKEQARLVLDEFLALPLSRSIFNVRSITREHIYAFHKALRDRGMSPRTIANKDARLRSWLKFCKADLSFLPPKPKFEETLPTIYSPSEVKSILEAADPYMGIAIRLGLMLGLREQEIMYAEWDDIDWHQSVYRVQGKPRLGFAVKDSAQRLIPIPTELLTRLKEWQETRKGTTLIVGNDQDKPEGHLLRKLKQLARGAELNCGKCDGCLRKTPECEQWFLHKFRATFCTRMLRQTDAKTVQALAGHSDLNTTLAYLVPASGKELQAHANAINWTE